MNREVICFDAVAPARERGLKSDHGNMGFGQAPVAPARERGLKLSLVVMLMLFLSRSREGAWIEITLNAFNVLWYYSRSREGAWIEIGSYVIV